MRMNRRDDSGIAAIMTLVAMLAILGLVSFALDLGGVAAAARSAQNSADGAAMAAALSCAKGSGVPGTLSGTYGNGATATCSGGTATATASRTPTYVFAKAIG